MLGSERTGVDEFLLGHLPALLCLDLRLELADLLRHVSQVLRRVRAVAVQRTVSEGSASMTNLFCLRSWMCVSADYRNNHSAVRYVP